LFIFLVHDAVTFYLTMFSTTFTHAPSTSLQNFRVCVVVQKIQSRRMLIVKPQNNHFGRQIRWNTRIIWPPQLSAIHATVAASLTNYSS